MVLSVSNISHKKGEGGGLHHLWYVLKMISIRSSSALFHWAQRMKNTHRGDGEGGGVFVTGPAGITGIFTDLV